MIDQHDWDRLARFAAGECSTEETEEVARWAADAPEREEALAFIREVGAAAKVFRPQWDTDASWQRLVASRHARIRPPLQVLPARSRARGPWWSRWPAVAAAVAMIASSLTGLWYFQHEVRAREIVAVVDGAMLTRATSAGQRITFQLPDGSNVILAPASRLRYPASYGAARGRRDVYLEGLALFEVTHDERRPFLVHTERGVTEDLGTKFTVQEYPGDTTVQVVVSEGSVELRAAGAATAGALLRPGQLGRLTPRGDALVHSDVDLGRWLGWTHGRLVFDDTPLRDALSQLARWYDLEFVLADSAIAERHLTATVTGEAISETLALISSTLGVDYTRRGRVVTFASRHRMP